jgi:methylated-DNA-[protein]-cysteine S-methyltransferase
MAPVNFNERCYKLLSTVPSGNITTYKILAEALGTKAYRAVGNAMNKNPYPRDLVPCHRVINSDGRLGGYNGKTSEKIARLKAEGIEVNDEQVVDYKSKLHTF